MLEDFYVKRWRWSWDDMHVCRENSNLVILSILVNYVWLSICKYSNTGGSSYKTKRGECDIT
jgi:hypothetical protein